MRPGAAELARLAAASGALVLALASQGDVLVLGALLAVAAWRPAAVAGWVALVLVGWRWGVTALPGIAGAQDVLGAGGWVGPTRAAAATWAAAVAVALSAPDPAWRTVVATLVDGQRVATVEPAGRSLAGLIGLLATGATVGLVLAGPALAERPLVRVGGLLLGVVLAALGRALHRGLGRRAEIAALAAAVAAAALLVPVLPGWAGTVAGDAVGRGLLVAAAAGSAAVVAVLARGAVLIRQARH